MKRWRRGISATILAMVVLLAGCTSIGGAPASDVTAEQLGGEWRIPDQEGVKLVIHGDQTFEMRNWPSNLGCIAPEAEYVEDVDWGDGRDFNGVWQLGPEGYEYGLSLFSDSDVCPGVLAFSVWLVAGDLVIQDWLGTDADDNSASRLVELSR